MIIVLDYFFGTNSRLDGAEVLKKIRNISAIIPVILMTENEKKLNKFPELIENKLNYYVRKGDNILEKINNATQDFKYDVAETLEEWIEFRDNDTRKKPYMIKAETGQEYTLDEILLEVRQQTNFGKEFLKDFYSLTIKLLLLDKERIKTQKV